VDIEDEFPVDSAEVYGRRASQYNGERGGFACGRCLPCREQVFLAVSLRTEQVEFPFFSSGR
jgi:hypothetical protein